MGTCSERADNRQQFRGHLEGGKSVAWKKEDFCWPTVVVLR